MSPVPLPREFETLRLKYRPVTAGDAEAIYRYASSPSVTRYMDFERHTALDASETFAAQCERAWIHETAAPWAILVKATGQFIGVIELRLRPPKADFGYVFEEAVWGHGYGTEAATAVVQLALAQPNIYRVWATCDPENQASARVLQKAGLRFEARLENWAPRPQRRLAASPSLIYAVTKLA